MEILIRVATRADLKEILSIINEAVAHTTAIYDYEPWSFEKGAAWLADKQERGMPVVVAEWEGQVVGYGAFDRFRPREAYRNSVEHSVYVASNWRGKGIGHQLMAWLILEAKRRNCHTMIAGIDASNTGSIDFHKKFGFQEVGRIREVGYKFDRWLDLLFLQLFLKE